MFVDDLRENCAGAEAVGMTAILHRGAESTLPELERLLGIEPRGPETEAACRPHSGCMVRRAP